MPPARPTRRRCRRSRRGRGGARTAETSPRAWRSTETCVDAGGSSRGAAVGRGRVAMATPLYGRRRPDTLDCGSWSPCGPSLGPSPALRCRRSAGPRAAARRRAGCGRPLESGSVPWASPRSKVVPSRSTLVAIRSLPAFRPVVGGAAVARTCTVAAGTVQSTAPARVVPRHAPVRRDHEHVLEPRHTPDAGEPHLGCRAAGRRRRSGWSVTRSRHRAGRCAWVRGPARRRRSRARRPGARAPRACAADGRAGPGAAGAVRTASAHPTTGRRAGRPLGREMGPTGRWPPPRGRPTPPPPLGSPTDHLPVSQRQ